MVLLEKKLNEIMEDPRRARNAFTRLFSQEIDVTGSIVSSAFKVDKTYDYLLTSITAEAIYEDGTVIDDIQYLPRFGLVDPNPGEPLNGGDARERDAIKDNVSFINLTPNTLGNLLTHGTPIRRYIANNGTFEMVVSRDNINPAGGKSNLKVYVTYWGVNFKNEGLVI
jgi:hypothetical protein